MRIILILALVATTGTLLHATDAARFMAEASAQEAVKEGKIQQARLPKNPIEQRELDAACKKSPAEFYGWIWGKETQQKSPQSWSALRDVAQNPALYCQEQVAAYRRAQATASGTAGHDPVIAAEKMEAAQWAKSAEEHHTGTNAGVHYPKSDAEYAAMNAAAKTGVMACMDYLKPGGKNSGYANASWATMGESDAVAGCNRMGLRLLYQKD